MSLFYFVLIQQCGHKHKTVGFNYPPWISLDIMLKKSAKRIENVFEVFMSEMENSQVHFLYFFCLILCYSSEKSIIYFLL